MRVGLKNLNELFIKYHPGTKFTTLQPGSSAGAPAILFNLAAFAVINRPMLPEELVKFDYMYHRPPLQVRVGRGSFSKIDYSPPMLICVNRTNPIEKLTTEQVARIFTSGGGRGNISTWGQVGLTGPWAQRQIRVLGVAERTGEAVYMRRDKFGDFPLVSRYEGMPSANIGPRLAEDTAAIALVDRARIGADVKVVAIGENPAGNFSAASHDDVVAGIYPYTPYTFFFVNRDPAQPLDPFVREYLRMVLSAEGQRALTNEPNGFLPLLAKDVREELAKLQLPLTK
jgi:phosphate transport system substrate-binding protein